MRLESACIKYFSCFSTLIHYKDYSRCDRAIAILSLVSFCTLVVPVFVGIAYFACRKCKKVNNLSTTDQKVKSVSESALDNVKGLDQIGGFSRGINNTCFIATTLQAMRQIPLVRNRLLDDLVQKEGESDELFASRQKITSTLSHFYNETDKGHTVKSSEFRKFHELLHQYWQLKETDWYPISPPGKSGSQSTVFFRMMEILEFKSEVDYKELLMNQKNEMGIKWLNDHSIKETIEGREAQLFIIQRINSYNGNSDPLPNDIPLEFTLEHSNEKGPFALVAATGSVPNHAVAYLKEIGNPEGWVFCNDSSISKVKDISKL